MVGRILYINMYQLTVRQFKKPMPVGLRRPRSQAVGLAELNYGSTLLNTHTYMYLYVHMYACIYIYIHISVILYMYAIIDK
jgi:hypothetical protein